MITCPVCKAENSHLAVTCKQCGSFVQSKVDTLDLFATIWLLMESPRKAFRRISLARHKNYIIFLSFIVGIALSFFIMWVLSIGDLDVSLPQLLATGFVVGPLVGFVTLLLLAVIQKLVAKTFRLDTRIMNAAAVIAYALVPVALSVIFILPIEILTFGKLFFSTNPSPYLLKPTSYIVLLALDGLTLFWSSFLYVLGIRALYDLGIRKALIVSGLTIAVYCVVMFSGISAVLTKMSRVPRDEKARLTVEVGSFDERTRG